MSDHPALLPAYLHRKMSYKIIHGQMGTVPGSDICHNTDIRQIHLLCMFPSILHSFFHVLLPLRFFRGNLQKPSPVPDQEISAWSSQVYRMDLLHQTGFHRVLCHLPFLHNSSIQSTLHHQSMRSYQPDYLPS